MELEVAYEVEVASTTPPATPILPPPPSSPTPPQTGEEVTFLGEFSASNPTPSAQEKEEEQEGEIVFLGEFHSPAAVVSCCLPQATPTCHHGEIVVPVRHMAFHPPRRPHPPATATFVNTKYLAQGVSKVLPFFPQPPESEWVSVPVFHHHPVCSSWHMGAPPDNSHIFPHFWHNKY